jgi:hypothetical protein
MYSDFGNVGTLQPNRAYKQDSLENSHIYKLLALNQQLGNILLVLVVKTSINQHYLGQSYHDLF